MVISSYAPFRSKNNRNLFYGELDPDAGEISLFNRMLNKRPTRQRVRMGLG